MNTLSSKFYILDTTNYTWVSNFNLNISKNNAPPTVTGASTSMQPQSNSIFIAIGVISGIACISVTIIVGFLIYKWHKKRNTLNVIPTPGTNVKFIFYKSNNFDKFGIVFTVYL